MQALFGRHKEREIPPSKRPSRDRGMGATTNMGNRARKFPEKKGKLERKWFHVSVMYSAA